MAVSVEWLTEPHIVQVTYQGANSLEDIVRSWQVVEQFYLENQIRPFCVLVVILPDRQIPIGFLQLVGHPVTRVMKYIDAAAVTGIDNFMIGKVVETLASMPFAPQVKTMDSYEAGVTYLRQFVRAEQAGV